MRHLKARSKKGRGTDCSCKPLAPSQCCLEFLPLRSQGGAGPGSGALGRAQDSTSLVMSVFPVQELHWNGYVPGAKPIPSRYFYAPRIFFFFLRSLSLCSPNWNSLCKPVSAFQVLGLLQKMYQNCHMLSYPRIEPGIIFKQTCLRPTIRLKVSKLMFGIS